MAARIIITEKVKKIRKIKDAETNRILYYAYEMIAKVSPNYPKGVPKPQESTTQYTVLLGKKQYDKLNQEALDYDLQITQCKLRVNGEIFLDVSFDILEGDVAVVALLIENMDVQAIVKGYNKETNEKTDLKEDEVDPESVNIKQLPLEQIMIPEPFLQNSPRPEKIAAAISFYKENQRFDKPVTVRKEDGQWVLQDSYTRYIAAKQLNLAKIEVDSET